MDSSKDTPPSHGNMNNIHVSLTTEQNIYPAVVMHYFPRGFCGDTRSKAFERNLIDRLALQKNENSEIPRIMLKLEVQFTEIL
jgi:hypothetical protein